MRFTAEYRIPETDNKCILSKDEYLLVNSVGYYEFDETIHGITHRKYGRKDFYLAYNIAGNMIVRCDGADNVIDSGTVFIYRPYEEQYYGNVNMNEPISCYWIHFTGYGTSELLLKANMGDTSIFNIGIDDSLTSLFENIINEITVKGYNFEYLASSMLNQMIFTISRKITSVQSINRENYRDVQINKTVKYIHKNYSNKIVITDLANIASLSPNRFSSVFKEFTGYSPQQYIINLRITKACQLMLHTGLNIRQVSYMVGIDDQLYFSRLFKKYKGQSPKDFMKQIKSNNE